MCKKYPLIAMLLVGSAIHSLSANAGTAKSMVFKGKVEQECSATVASTRGTEREILFQGQGLDPAKHVHELTLSGNANSKINFEITEKTTLKESNGSSADKALLKIMTKVKAQANYAVLAGLMSGLPPAETVSIYLTTPTRAMNSFAVGDYEYEVVATIDCD